MESTITQEYRYTLAPKGKRFLAFLIDILIFAGIVFLIRKPVSRWAADLLGISLSGGTPEAVQAAEYYYYVADCIIGLPIAMLVYFLPPLFFKNGQTLGKKVMGLIVIQKNGQPIRLVHLLLRTLVGFWIIEYVLSVLLNFSAFLLTAVFVLVTKNGRAMHDFVARTLVVEDKKILVDVLHQPLPPIEEDLKEIVEEVQQKREEKKAGKSKKNAS